MDEIETSEKRSTAWKDDISYHFDPFRMAKSASGPLSVRGLLKVGGKVISADRMGKLLGYYRDGEFFRRQTIYMWERHERGERLAERYVMSANARECYRRLLSDLVEASSHQRLMLVAHMGARVWRFQLRAKCRSCGRFFEPRRRTAVRCVRCIAKGRR